MKILLCSVPFRPSVGGIETVSEILANGFQHAGHDVLVVTQTPAADPDHAPFLILRIPSAGALWDAVRWADVVFHNNISLRLAWPLLALRKPWVIAHHTWLPRTASGWAAGRLKLFVARFADNIAISQAIAQSLSAPATVVPNPYADDLFVARPDAPRPSDLVFLGRLVSDKGLSVLLDALARLRERGHEPTLTVVGGGPEEVALRAQVRGLQLDGQVRFAGVCKGRALVDLLNQHRIMIVPSVWEEPFGIVALEGIACGAVPIVTRSGGLPEAIGRCGLVVPKSDSAALAAAIERLNGDASLLASFRAEAPQHLARHTRGQIIEAYLCVLERASRKPR
jgi:glycogen(starch) synthase